MARKSQSTNEKLHEMLGRYSNTAVYNGDPEHLSADFETSDSSDDEIDRGFKMRSYYENPDRGKVCQHADMSLNQTYLGDPISRNAADNDFDIPIWREGDLVTTAQEKTETQHNYRGAFRSLLTLQKSNNESAPRGYEDLEVNSGISNSNEYSENFSADESKELVCVGNDRRDGSPVENLNDKADRAALRNIAHHAKPRILQSLSKAAAVDVRKGKDVQLQRRTFNFLLDTRMRLQKSITSANRLRTNYSSITATPENRDSIKFAEEAAITLMNNINSLRKRLPQTALDQRGTKRTFSTMEYNTLPNIFESIADLEQLAASNRTATLDLWAKRTTSVAVLAKSDRLRSSSDQQPFTESLESQGGSQYFTRLTNRTKKAQTCALSETDSQKNTHEHFYDDGDWYATLLRELIENKMGSSKMRTFGNNTRISPAAASVNALRREAKTHRASLDVKASKGRKMRFDVQEPIQNFLAPDDRSTWGEKQMNELFGSLIGNRIQGSLQEDEDMFHDMMNGDTEIAKDGALRLFGGQERLQKA